MNSSDWITIVSSFVAVLAGMGVSWAFFRTQLALDIQSLRTSLEAVKQYSGLASLLDTWKQLNRVASKVGNIEKGLRDTRDDLTALLREQNKNTIAQIQAHLAAQGETAFANYEEIVRREVSRVVNNTDSQKQLIAVLESAFSQSLETIKQVAQVESQANNDSGEQELLFYRFQEILRSAEAAHEDIESAASRHMLIQRLLASEQARKNPWTLRSLAAEVLPDQQLISIMHRLSSADKSTPNREEDLLARALAEARSQEKPGSSSETESTQLEEQKALPARRADSEEDDS